MTPRLRAWQTMLADEGERAWTMPDGCEIVLSPPVAEGSAMSFVARARRDGTLVYCGRHVVVNPPVQGARAALHEIVEAAVGRALSR